MQIRHIESGIAEIFCVIPQTIYVTQQPPPIHKAAVTPQKTVSWPALNSKGEAAMVLLA